MAYWLFKTEPTAYSFASLMAEPDRTTGWDGVRNYQARNLLRDQLQVGDGVLFYHSSADPPCIAGIAEVVRAAHPDPTAFDRKAGHYDPKSDPAREPLSRFQRLSLTLSAVGLVISVLGFTAVIVSIRTAQEQMSYTAAQTRVLTRDRSLSNVLTLHKIFLDHPELSPYFFEGKDLDESHPLYPRVEAVADMHLDGFAYNLDYRLIFPEDRRAPDEYKRYIRSRLSLSPVMRRRLELKADWFSPDLQEALKGSAVSNTKRGN